MPYCYPPDPNTRKPKFTPPPNSCDTHFHVFGPPEQFPFVSTHEYTPPAAPLEHYRKMIAVIGIERAVVVQPSVHGLDNTATLDAIKNSAGKFRGVGRIDDKTPKSELQRLHDNGIRGVRFNLLDRPRGNIKLDVLDRCVENIVEFGWSVDLHIDMVNLLAQEKRIRNMPIPVVIDHIARVKPAEGLRQAGISAAARSDETKTCLDQSQRRGQDLRDEGAFVFRSALRRSDPLCASGHRRRFGPGDLGHRLAPFE